MRKKKIVRKKRVQKIISKLKKPSWSNFYRLLKTSWSVQTREFFENSTLHGVRYVAEDGRPFCEKFMWFVCVFVGLITSVIIIFSLWEKFQTNPTITGLDTDFHNWEVPFPAIIVCQKNPANETFLDEFIEDNFGDSSEKDKLKNLLRVLTELSYDSMKEMAKFKEFYNFPFTEKSIKNLIFPLMNKCEDIFDNCDWKAKPYNCCEGFSPVFTESGFCYSFNSRHYEKKYPWTDELLPQFDQLYIKETDPKWSLAFTVKNTDSEMPIYILNSDEMAGIDLKPQHVWDFRMKSISFSVKQTYTTEDAKQLSVKQRHCVFPKERKLEVDYIYTYTACTRQCRMDSAMQLCRCVPFFYPINRIRSRYRHCEIAELECISNNLEKIIGVEKCDCQLGCFNTVYEVEKLNNNNGEEIKTMEVEFMSWPMIRYKREVLFGWVDLLVSFGGIAGLFLGFSLLSGVEIIYYFTIRAYFMVVKERNALEKIYQQKKLKPSTNYDLSLTPYFISVPLPGNGINELTKEYSRKKKNKNRTKIMPLKRNWKPADTIFPPFGIQYLN